MRRLLLGWLLVASVLLAEPAIARAKYPLNPQQAEAKAAICRKFGRTCRKAQAVGNCESSYHSGATNAGQLGLFQIYVKYHLDVINRLGFTGQDMLRPWPNILVAYALSDGGRDWGIWGCRSASVV